MENQAGQKVPMQFITERGTGLLAQWNLLVVNLHGFMPAMIFQGSPIVTMYGNFRLEAILNTHPIQKIYKLLTYMNGKYPLHLF